jgi:cytochrome c1
MPAVVDLKCGCCLRYAHYPLGSFGWLKCPKCGGYWDRPFTVPTPPAPSRTSTGRPLKPMDPRIAAAMLARLATLEPPHV